MIKRVRIQNYKSLDWVDVHLDPVTVLIGRSGTGKSNFVEALRFLRDYVTYRNDTFVGNLGGWGRILSATAPRPLSFSFSLCFDAPGVSEDYEYTLSFQQSPKQDPYAQPAFQEERLSLGNRVLFHQRQGKWLHQPDVVNPPSPGPLMLGALTGVREVTIAHLVLSSGLGCYAFPDTVLLQPAPPSASPSPQEIGLSDRGGNYLQVFSAITINLQAWHHLKEMVAALQKLNPSIKGVDLHLPQRDKIVVSHDVGGRLLVLDLNQESEGFRRFLAHLIALYQVPPKQTLVFEEPEKGIHPGALAVLADQFKACPEAGRGQNGIKLSCPSFVQQGFP
jgi:predicted ATPase